LFLPQLIFDFWLHHCRIRLALYSVPHLSTGARTAPPGLHFLRRLELDSFAGFIFPRRSFGLHFGGHFASSLCVGRSCPAAQFSFGFGHQSSAQATRTWSSLCCLSARWRVSRVDFSCFQSHQVAISRVDFFLASVLWPSSFCSRASLPGLGFPSRGGAQCLIFLQPNHRCFCSQSALGVFRSCWTSSPRAIIRCWSVTACSACFGFRRLVPFPCALVCLGAWPASHNVACSMVLTWIPRSLVPL
jgi:hypothetical protein